MGLSFSGVPSVDNVQINGVIGRGEGGGDERLVSVVTVPSGAVAVTVSPER